MKPKFLVLTTLALSVHYAQGAPITWADLAGNTNWGSGTSWVGGVAPANSFYSSGDVAIFTSVANAQPNLAATRSVNGIDVQLPSGGLNFTSDPGAVLNVGFNGIDATTQLEGENVVSVESIKLNNSAPTFALFSNADNASTSTFTFSSNINLNGLTLHVKSNRSDTDGNVGIVNLSGNISGSPSPSLRLSSLGGAHNTINLTGNSSYTGSTRIEQVRVTANSLANDGVNSALGSSGPIFLGYNAAYAELEFKDLSVDSSTDRFLNLRGTSGSSAYRITNSDPDHTIAFTNPGDTGDTTGTYTTNLVFSLSGSNTGDNIFGQVINDRNGTNKTMLRKEGSGTWVLTNINTYTGETFVNGGLLRIDNADALGSGNLTVNGGVLGLKTGDMTSRTVGTGDGQVTWTNSGGFAAFGADRTVSFGTPGTSIAWNATDFIGNNRILVLGHWTSDATLIWDQQLSLAGDPRTVYVYDGSAAIDAKISRSINGGDSISNDDVLNKSGAGTLALTANSFHFGDTNVNGGTLMIGAGGTSGGTSTNSLNITVASGATLAANRSNTLTQGTANLITAISGEGGFAQVGSGNTVFMLANVYTGPTTVAAGTLTLGASGVLPDTSAVSIGAATLDTSDGVAEDAGTLATTGAAIINLGIGATIAFADSSALELDWTGTLNITGDFVPGSSIRFGTTSSALSAGQLATISVNGSGAGTYSLNASGYLVVAGVGTPYDNWAGASAFTDDDNGDGLDNGLAWILGAASPNVGALDKLPAVSNPTGYLQLDFTRVNPYAPAKLYVEYGSDLSGWTKLELPASTGTIGGDIEVTVAGGTPDAVQVKIPTSHATGGKLFTRLSVENP